VATLASRVDQRQAILDGYSAMIAQVEQLVLPSLRDAVLSGWAGDAVQPDVAGWLTERYQVDVATSGTVLSTRMDQAVQSVQATLFALRASRLPRAHPAGAWSLDSEQRFDQEWRWIGSYDGWRAATLAFLYPENLLLPSLRTDRRQPFADLLDALASRPAWPRPTLGRSPRTSCPATSPSSTRATSSWSGQRVAAMRARSASISASGVTGIVNDRIAVVPADSSVGTDIRVSSIWFGRVVDIGGRTSRSRAFRGGQALAHADPLAQAVRPHNRAPGGCGPPVTSLADTLAVTLVSYRAPARPAPPVSPPCPVSLALSTPSPSAPAATSAPTSATTAPSRCSASPTRPHHPAPRPCRR
jgi:hypothetical protein